MNPPEQEKERRDGLVFLLFLPFSVVLMLVAGQWALHLAPHWSLQASMDSSVDLDGGFSGAPAGGQVEPVLASILTPPSWQDTFLTPSASQTAGHSPTTIPDPGGGEDTGTTLAATATGWATLTGQTPSGATSTATSTLTPTAVTLFAATATPTAMPPPAATHTSTPTRTMPPSSTATSTRTLIPTSTHTPSATSSPTIPPSSTPTYTPTATDTPTPTPTSTYTATPTYTPTTTNTPTSTPTATPTDFTPFDLAYDCEAPGSHSWRIFNPNSFFIDFSWTGDGYGGSGTLHPGWNTFSTPLGGSGYAITVTYDGGSTSASSTGDICPLP